jgi:hypothetical protein
VRRGEQGTEGGLTAWVSSGAFLLWFRWPVHAYVGDGARAAACEAGHNRRPPVGFRTAHFTLFSLTNCTHTPAFPHSSTHADFFTEIQQSTRSTFTSALFLILLHSLFFSLYVPLFVSVRRAPLHPYRILMPFPALFLFLSHRINCRLPTFLCFLFNSSRCSIAFRFSFAHQARCHGFHLHCFTCLLFPCRH